MASLFREGKYHPYRSYMTEKLTCIHHFTPEFKNDPRSSGQKSTIFVIGSHKT